MIEKSLYKILSFAPVYSALMAVLGGPNAMAQFVQRDARIKTNYRVLDLGCGPASLLRYLPESIEYVGIDFEPSYIQNAQEQYKRGTFICENVLKLDDYGLANFDVVLAVGLLHHLNDNESIKLLTTAKSALKPSGRLVTLDGCFTQPQHPLARFLLKRDRGRFVRETAAYQSLARAVFGSVEIKIHTDLLTVPFTHIAMECSQSERVTVSIRKSATPQTCDFNAD